MVRIIHPGATEPNPGRGPEPRQGRISSVRARLAGALAPIFGCTTAAATGARAVRGTAAGATALTTVIGFAAASALLPARPAAAGPVLCTTSLEAPIIGTRDGNGVVSAPLSPVEVTRCGIVQTAPDLLERRAYSWTSPFARGVDMTHQVTDLFGIAMGGGDGTKVMGFGFGDQTLIWDGSAIENTSRVMLDDQSNPMPLRTSDLVGVYGSSLGGGVAMPHAPQATIDSGGYRSATNNRSVRGMW